MAEAYKRLAAKVGNGTIGTASNLYTVTGLVTNAVISSIVVCNTATTSQTFSLAVSQVSANFAQTGDGGAVASIGGYLVFNAPIAPYDTITLSIGVCLDATNKYLLGSSSSALVAFSIFGAEIT